MLSEHEAAAETVLKYDGESHSSSDTYAGVVAVAVGDSHRLFVHKNWGGRVGKRLHWLCYV